MKAGTKERAKKREALTQPNNTHLQRPNSSNPHLELPLYPLNVLQLYSLPPTSSGWFPPKQKQLLRHADSVIPHVTSNIRA